MGYLEALIKLWDKNIWMILFVRKVQTMKSSFKKKSSEIFDTEDNETEIDQKKV